MPLIYITQWFLFYRKFAELSEADRREKFDKHRFLVQSKAISEAEWDKLKAIPLNDRADEVTIQFRL